MVIRILFIHFEPVEEFPYKKIRYSFSNFKKRVTALIKNPQKLSNEIRIEEYPDYGLLYTKYALSNSHLKKTLNLDLGEYGYPVVKEIYG